MSEVSNPQNSPEAPIPSEERYKRQLEAALYWGSPAKKVSLLAPLTAGFALVHRRVLLHPAANPFTFV